MLNHNITTGKLNVTNKQLLGMFMYVHCTVHNCSTQSSQNRPDNFLSYSPDNHHCSDYIYFREGETKGEKDDCISTMCAQPLSH